VCCKSTRNPALAPIYEIPTHQKIKQKKDAGMHLKIIGENIDIDTNSL